MEGREARNHLREHQEEQRLGEIANPLLLQGLQKIPQLPRLERSAKILPRKTLFSGRPVLCYHGQFWV